MYLKAQEYKLILENSPNMVWRSGVGGKCDYFNKTWLNFTGKKMEDELGDGWANGVHPDDLDRCLRIYKKAFSNKERFEMNYRLLRHDGIYRIINDRGVPFYSDQDKFLGYIGSCIDVTEKIEGESLKEMAIKDGLTKLLNRQYFLNKLEKQISRSKMFNYNLSLIMIDVDHFKEFNDNYGHICGDRVLKNLAKTIVKSIRDKVFAGRYGGDEFLIALPETNLKDAIKVIKRICLSLENHHIKCNKLKLKTCISV